VQQVTRKYYEMEDVELEVTEIEMQEVDEEVEEEVLEDVEMPVEVSRRIYVCQRSLFYMNLLSLPMTILFSALQYLSRCTFKHLSTFLVSALPYLSP
jgi:hypothetical protein